MGSKEESRIISPEDLVPGTKTVVIGACAPIHPRVGPAVRPDVPIRADLLLFFSTMAARSDVLPTTGGRTRRDRGAIDSMAQASHRRRAALADRAGDVQFCADDLIWPTTGNDHAH
jgi:hypothetical protein